jgi:hypothetical protein
LSFKVDYVDALQQVRGVDGRSLTLEGDRTSNGSVLARVRQSDYQVKSNKLNLKP